MLKGLLLLLLKTLSLPPIGDVLHTSCDLCRCRCLLLHITARFAVL